MNTKRFFVLLMALTGCSGEPGTNGEELQGSVKSALLSPGDAMCGRGPSGISCVRSTGTSFGSASVWSSSFSDANGWFPSPHANTISYPDVNGDGDTDVCGRAVAGIKCALSTGTSFNSYSTWSSEFSDANGWDLSTRYLSIRYPDLNGDGRADVCGRAASGVTCALSTGTGFGSYGLWASTFSDANGYFTAPYGGTIQFGDLNGDGDADVCGRGVSGIKCGLSNGGGFDPVTVWSSAFSDANGWNVPSSYETIKLVDVNNDGMDDICGRAVSGMKCALSTGSAFGALATWQSAATAFSDANGYNTFDYYSTIQYGDVNADGLPDVCVRAASGMKCALSSGSAFGAASVWSSTYSDAGGWSSQIYYSSIELSDLDNDGRADVCGRGSSGLKCALSSGSAFGTVTIWSSFFSDANSWNQSTYYNSLTFSDP